MTAIDLRKSIVAPHEGAWIEISHRGSYGGFLSSHPTRVRGLKFIMKFDFALVFVSHPTRVRGLKYHLQRFGIPFRVVAPHEGAWIEISYHVIPT